MNKRKLLFLSPLVFLLAGLIGISLWKPVESIRTELADRAIVRKAQAMARCFEAANDEWIILEAGGFADLESLYLAFYAPEGVRQNMDLYYTTLARCGLKQDIRLMGIEWITLRTAVTVDDGEVHIIGQVAARIILTRRHLQEIITAPDASNYVHVGVDDGTLVAHCYVCNPFEPAPSYVIVKKWRWKPEAALAALKRQ